MISRLTIPERVAGGAALVGIGASFLTWYGYASGTTQVTVDGFRSSLLGDVFFIACAAILLFVAARARLVSIGRVANSIWLSVVAVAAGSIAIQLVLAIAGGRSLHKGLLAAVLCGAALLWAGRRLTTESNSYDGIL